MAGAAHADVGGAGEEDADHGAVPGPHVVRALSAQGRHGAVEAGAGVGKVPEGGKGGNGGRGFAPAVIAHGPAVRRCRPAAVRRDPRHLRRGT